MEKLKAEILKFHPEFDEATLNDGLNHFKRRELKAKDLLLEAGAVCNEMVFAEAGIIRCYYPTEEGEEHTLWMKPEQTFITEYKSFSTGTPSQFYLQTYEDTTVYSISRTGLKELYKESTDWAQFGVFLTEHVHTTLIDVFVNLLSNDATANYQYIAYAFPRFLQVAPLKDIASMLQVSPVTLSRIRAGTQRKA